MAEEILAGGNLNPVVRVGKTVRRVPGTWTPAVHELLRYLEAQDFEGAPRVLGFDDQGREILTFIGGTTDSSGDPGWVWSEAALLEAAHLIRRYHDLCRSFRPAAESQWQVMVGAPTSGEIICHNDLAPYNAVYRQGVPIALRLGFGGARVGIVGHCVRGLAIRPALQRFVGPRLAGRRRRSGFAAALVLRRLRAGLRRTIGPRRHDRSTDSLRARHG